MKKVGIVTIESQNYGNRLQNYALQYTIEKLGAHVETFRRHPRNITLVQKIKTLLRTRYGRFQEFDRYIHWSDLTLDESTDMQELSERYDVFLVGSDQVWNPHFKCNSDVEFLNAIPDEKKYTYAVSIGLSEIPIAYQERFSNVSTFTGLSVRENEAKQILKRIYRKEINVHIDPTMLLSAKEWEKVMRPSHYKPKQSYVLVYFLGNAYKKYEERIKTIANTLNLNILDISPDKGNKAIGPMEFIYLISQAQFICTDSFHGSVFAIIFQKLFEVYNRPTQEGYGQMSSRIDTLLKTFKLESRVYSGKNNDVQATINYLETQLILRERKSDSLSYLKRILNMT